jgi:hypothetical protein
MPRRLSDMTERDIERAVDASDNRLIDEMDEEESEEGEESPCRGCRRRCPGSDCPLF